MAQLGVETSYRVPEDAALAATAMIYHLGPLGSDAAEEAAYQLGWNEELVHKAVPYDEEDDD